MSILRILILAFVMLFLLPLTSAPLPRAEATVHGRIEILNPKVKRSGGQADAGGVVVWLRPTKGVPIPVSGPAPKRKMEQHDKRFSPHVMAVQVGTEIDFPNLDPFFHNVFSVYDGKIFDLGLYANGESRPVRFDRPGVSFIFCNIHPQMSAVVVAVESPWFAVSGPDGNYTIKGVPPGEYKVHYWHERGDPRQTAALTRLISIGSSGGDLGVTKLDESDYVTRPHRNKYGDEYDNDQGPSPYRRP